MKHNSHNIGHFMGLETAIANGEAQTVGDTVADQKSLKLRKVI
ncbi:hypothetical protein FX988_04181 [Paraglaciecola mesophila]|uniref:Uncharacterized protein n=1 Tax=Paraglaciecola mesophila TaxID=197222 RepID=A0A857JRS3_9ALTE|nr:hypothetical protein [Paraglaciecola mesophila]QHJ13900.1 hypothetical protein FX988_04181 [Paraglaciecola mesophila]